MEATYARAARAAHRILAGSSRELANLKPEPTGFFKEEQSPS